MERNLLQEGLWETEGVLPYDAACKRLLSEREILARIMKECLPEYGQCKMCIRDRVRIPPPPPVRNLGASFGTPFSYTRT